MCKQVFQTGTEFNECKRKLLVEEEKCHEKKCEANYGEWTAWTVCSGSCIENLDQSDQSGKPTNIEKRKRSRACQSDQNLCEKDNGEDETLFCDSPKLCPLKEDVPSTSLLASKYTFYFDM